MSLDPDLVEGKRIDEYELRERLSSYSHVWLAIDTGGQREVVLKFVNDHSSAAREGTILADIEHPNILKLLRKFDYQGVPVLVFEYVPGIRLDKAIRSGLSHKDSYTICLNISSALTAIHQVGLYHGDLSPFNVMWSEQKGKAYLIDFGAMGGCTVLSAAPEHDPANRLSIGPHTDIVGLGRIVLMLLPEMRNVYDRCLIDDINLRPSAQFVHDAIRKARDRHKIILRGTLTVITLVLAALIGSYFRKPTHDEIIRALIEDTPNQENLDQLKNHLFDPAFKDFRDLILRGIAEKRRALGKEALVLPHLENYVAIFALHQNPLIILEQGHLELGDPVVIAGEGGFIQEINRGSVVLQTTNGSKEILYPKAQIMGRGTQTFKPVNILGGKLNFFYIFQTICKVNKWEFKPNGQIDGVLAGSWDCDSYEDFLKKCLGHVTKTGYTVTVLSAAVPRSVIAVDRFMVIRNKTLSALLAEYEPLVGYSIDYVGKNNPADLYYPVLQFHDLLAVMGLKATIIDQKILVQEGESQ